MPYRAIKKGDLLQLSEIDEAGNQVRYIGAAPDKEALRQLLGAAINAKKGPPAVMEFDDDGKVTKDDVVETEKKPATEAPTDLAQEQ